MRKSATENLQGATVVSLSAIQSERLRALSPFGPVKAGLTTSQRIELAQLEELLSYLERQVKTLVSKSYEVLDISKQDTKAPRVEHYAFTYEKDGTK